MHKLRIQILKLIRLVIYTLLLVALLLFSLSRVELWRGKKQWESMKIKLAANGLPIDWSNAIPTPVPDDENLAMSRVLTDCYNTIERANQHENWQSDPVFDESASIAAKQAEALYAPCQLTTIEGPFGFHLSESELLDVFATSDSERIDQLATVLAPYHPILAELRDACEQRPQSYFPGDYTTPATAPTQSFKLIRSAVQLLTAEAILRLHQGNAGLALENCHALNRIANLNPQTPFLVNTMVQTVVLRKYLSEVLWYGISHNVFNELQLRDITELCRQNAPIINLGKSFQFEILYQIATIEAFNQSPIELSRIFGSNGYLLLLGCEQTFTPLTHRILWYLSPAKGWNLQMAQRHLDWANDYNAVFDLKRGTVDLKQMAQLNEALEQVKVKDAFFDSLLLVSIPAHQKITETAINAQRRLDLIEIAATLILATKQGQALPTSIHSGFESLPTDPTNEQSYAYQKSNHGFSIGSTNKETLQGIDSDLVINWSPTQ
jgi:hypothetical protein